MRTVLAVLPLLAALALPGSAQQANYSEAAATRQLRLASEHRLSGDETTARTLARNVLDKEPDHAGARAFLGYRLFRDRWRLEPEIAYLQHLDASKSNGKAPPVPARDPVVEAAADRRAQAVRQPDARRADAARREMIALAERAHRPDLQQRAERDYWRARLAWQAVQLPVGILSLRVQQVQLLGMDTVTVGLGTGTGRIQLPRTQSISFGGTVALPLGSGH
ncbi:MAG TPA: hypothetical protein VK348_07915 [Planctomycetota bacterium]|nr:hypothetical protein [Planctomycetota bacterium]